MALTASPPCRSFPISALELMPVPASRGCYGNEHSLWDQSSPDAVWAQCFRPADGKRSVKGQAVNILGSVGREVFIPVIWLCRRCWEPQAVPECVCGCSDETYLRNQAVSQIRARAMVC